MTVAARPAALRGLEIGEPVRVSLLRDGGPTTVSVTLAEAR